MPGGYQKPIDPKIKEQILERVRLGLEPVAQIAREFKVSESTVHHWLEKKVTHAPNQMAAENVRLRRELAEITDLFARVCLELERTKKKISGL